MKLIIAVFVVGGGLLVFFAQSQDKAGSKNPSEKTPVKVQISKKEPEETSGHDHDGGDKGAMRFRKNDNIPLANTNKVNFTNLHMMASYIMGVQMAGSLKMQGVMGDYIDHELLIMGIRDVFGNHMPLVDMNTAENVNAQFEKDMREKYDERVKGESEGNLQAGRAFLEANKKKKGVVSLSSGTQYRILKEGSGENPKDGDKIAFHFRGKKIDGDEFSTSYKHKQAPTVAVDRQIMGLRETLKLMKPGARWEVFIPSELAYGSRDVGKGVGANATLIFEVELMEIVKTEAEK